MFKFIVSTVIGIVILWVIWAPLGIIATVLAGIVLVCLPSILAQRRREDAWSARGRLNVLANKDTLTSEEHAEMDRLGRLVAENDWKQRA